MSSGDGEPPRIDDNTQDTNNKPDQTKPTTTRSQNGISIRVSPRKRACMISSPPCTPDSICSVSESPSPGMVSVLSSSVPSTPIPFMLVDDEMSPAQNLTLDRLVREGQFQSSQKSSSVSPSPSSTVSGISRRDGLRLTEGNRPASLNLEGQGKKLRPRPQALTGSFGSMSDTSRSSEGSVINTPVRTDTPTLSIQIREAECTEERTMKVFEGAEQIDHGCYCVSVEEVVEKLVKMDSGYLDLFSGKWRLLFVDCRFPEEYEGGTINGAVNITVHGIKNKLKRYFFDTIKEKVIIIFFCEFSKNRSIATCSLFSNMNDVFADEKYGSKYCTPYNQIYVMKNGYKEFYNYCVQNNLLHLTTKGKYRPMNECTDFDNLLCCFEAEMNEASKSVVSSRSKNMSKSCFCLPSAESPKPQTPVLSCIDDKDEHVNLDDLSADPLDASLHTEESTADIATTSKKDKESAVCARVTLFRKRASFSGQSSDDSSVHRRVRLDSGKRVRSCTHKMLREAGFNQGKKEGEQSDKQDGTVGLLRRGYGSSRDANCKRSSLSQSPGISDTDSERESGSEDMTDRQYTSSAGDSQSQLSFGNPNKTDSMTQSLIALPNVGDMVDDN